MKTLCAATNCYISLYAFDTFDANDDGTIDFNEYLLCISATKGGDVDDRLSFSFDLYHISDDGLIDQKELVHMITTLYELNGIHDRTGDHNPKTRAAEIIASLDVSGDEKLCEEEFIARCKSDPYLREILAPNVRSKQLQSGL
ncbi:unnamed protein product [Rotaria magnacalcarata]|uniref:EF-hand domain-containing protein n=1 Tax=Rotaria magnacalcarata TaxID=392030 RepID=A0A816W762_9BILA|nr:unnamed protein product [Rotaria magnacalcarata]CAF3871481.1 unnamed protein product [Rotaria magnacalcarata]